MSKYISASNEHLETTTPTILSDEPSVYFIANMSASKEQDISQGVKLNCKQMTTRIMASIRMYLTAKKKK